jgi:hypothetical protein
LFAKLMAKIQHCISKGWFLRQSLLLYRDSERGVAA